MLKKGLVLILILSILMAGCTKEVNNDDIAGGEINNLKMKINELESLVEKLTKENERLIKELGLIKSDDSKKVVNLLKLTKEELEIYDRFKKNYNELVLKDVEPLSICKFYLYSWCEVKDYETEYELLIQEEEFVMWTKEEHINMPHDSNRDWKEFKNAINVKTNIVDEDSAYIS